MLLDLTFLDDATRPEPPQLRGLTRAQRLPGQHLAMIHDHLRDNMKVLGGLIERASSGSVTPDDVVKEAEELGMVSNYRRFGTLCGEHCEFVHTHHSIEDEAIFPGLSRHAEIYARIAERLKAEHSVIHEVLTRLVAALEDLARDPTRARFEEARDVYSVLERVLLSHLGYEERAIGDALGYFRIGV